MEEIRLKPLEEENLNFVLDLRRSIAPYMGNIFFKNKRQNQDWFKMVCQSDEIFVFIVYLEKQTIGYGILDKIDYIHRRCYGQVQLLEDFRGLGYGTQAFAELLKIAFEQLDMNKVCLETFPNNERAKKVYKKLGFKSEGLLRAHYFKEGKFVDSIQMGLLRKEFQG